MVNIKNTVNELDPYVPGRSNADLARAYGLDPAKIIRMGSNENPMGPSPMAIKALEENLHTINTYPESNIDDLKGKIASYAGTSPEEIIVGGDGADEILDVLAKTLIEPGDEYIVHPPSYMYYEFTFNIHGAVPVYARWDIEKNQLDLNSVLEAISPRTKVIFLCTPNNPSGGLIDKQDIRTILESTDALVVVDEAYWEFSGVNNLELLAEYDNLFILRTFSKVMGLAGMRIGYGIGHKDFIQYMHRVKPVFSLIKLSYLAAVTTLDDPNYIEKSTQLSIQSRDYLYREMSKFPALKVYQSWANYILVDVRGTGMNSKEISEELMKNGIIVRDCSSFRGLDDYWIRVSVATMEEDEQFINVLKNILQ
ncbi:histidinol-phosphate transaminase [uncultured Methanobacterium sp.]|uniref:histidinol-phosphate transaminase n=1 Tax=uncultured Methanobacterium sp. TaxID=176306 RepID=UPI002AA5FAEA|nr:histidinol-phosphate transaminase [uncultured Methanobacterium sp.]